ncbi:MAG: hypothetical protein R6V03_09205 [Kiritimatiellia bacterium]
MIRDGKGKKRKPAAYIWSRQSERAQKAWHRIDKTVGKCTESIDTVIDELNRLVNRADFYDPEAFEDVALPEWATRQIREGLDSLDRQELVKFNMTVLQQSIECIRKFKTGFASYPSKLFTRWIYSGDNELISLATESVRAANTYAIFGRFTDLGEGGCSTGLAMAYDAFEPYLSEEDKAEWLRLMETLLDLHLYTARSFHWNCTCIPNANPVCNSGGALLGMALLEELPEKARESIYWARRFIRHWLDYCCGSDGGNTEGAQYWQYGGENFLNFASALERILGHDEGLLDHPAVRNAMNMIRVSLTNDGALHGVNDTIPLTIGAGWGWLTASRFNDPFALWYADHAQRDTEKRKKAGKQTPYQPGGLKALLFRPDVPEATDQPPLPAAFKLDSIQYSVIRSGTNYDCTWVAGLKGSRPPYTHHNQPDTGSFYIHLRGERLLIDPGYHKGSAFHHSLPVIGGVAPRQPVSFVGEIINCETKGRIRYIACDSTRAYEGAARRAIRHLVMLGEEGLVLLDDIAAGLSVKSLYQCGGSTSALENTSFVIAGQRQKIRVDLKGDTEIDLKLEEERSLKDVHWGYNFADCRHFPVTADYAPSESTPLVTTFLDATESMPAEPAVKRANREITVAFPSGEHCVFVFNKEWRLAL